MEGRFRQRKQTDRGKLKTKGAEGKLKTKGAD